ncbi:MAG: hypothetical protein ACRC7V_07320 [Lachnospiraceae bacterium]
MNKKIILKWCIIILFFSIQCFVVPRIYFYNIKSMVHWLIYILLFICFFVLEDMKQFFQRLHYGITSRNFLVKAIAAFCFTYVVAIVLIYVLSDITSPIYPLWQPLHSPILWVWIPLYIILQPIVDNILYHKLLLGTSANIFVVIILRTFAETGLLIFNKTSAIGDNQMIILVLFCVNAIFSIFYFTSKNTAFSFIVELMYKMAIVITVLIGMSKLLIFSI